MARLNGFVTPFADVTHRIGVESVKDYDKYSSYYRRTGKIHPGMLKRMQEAGVGND